MRVRWVWCYVNLPAGVNILIMERNLTISACVGWTTAAGAFLYGKICWVSLGLQYDNELPTVICNWWHQNKSHHTHSRHSRHLGCRAGDRECDCGEKIINNRHQLQLQLQLQLLPAGLISAWVVDGAGLEQQFLSLFFPIVFVNYKL